MLKIHWKEPPWREGGRGGGGLTVLHLEVQMWLVTRYGVDVNDDVVFQFAKFSKNFLVYSMWKAPECSKFKRASVAGGWANCIALGSPDVTNYTLQVDFNDDVVF